MGKECKEKYKEGGACAVISATRIIWKISLMSVALVSPCARADALAPQLHRLHHLPPFTPFSSNHPFLVLGLVGPSRLVCLRLVSILGTCLRLFRVRRGRALLSASPSASASGIRLGDYDAISIARSRNERYKTTILVATTSAFGVVGELEGQLLRTLARRALGDTSQYEDK